MAEKGYTIDVTEADLDDLANGTVDYIGITYYLSNTVSTRSDANYLHDPLLGSSVLTTNPYATMTEWGWTIDHMGLRYMLNLLQDRYELPILLWKMALVLMTK